MSSASPWLNTTTSTAESNGNDMDPWATIDTGYLHPSSSSSSNQNLRSRKSSPSFPSTSTSQVVDRHPLRSPSPHQGVPGPSSVSRPGAAPRRPSAVASEWKAIGAGLAGLFGGASSSSSSSSYQWPADPASAGPSIRASRQSASHSATTSAHYDQDGDDEARKGRPVDSIESTLDRLEDWFGLRQEQQAASASGWPTSSYSHRSNAASTRPPTTSGDAEQVRVLIHPVAPTDTLASLALHYGADIQVLRKSNKLWPGDPVQIRKLIYIPVDSCKHRPPNAEIKVLPATQGAISADPSSSSSLVFVPKQEEEDFLTGTPTAEIAQPTLLIESLASVRVSDPVSDFMPDTNKAYLDSSAPTFGTSLTRAGSINGNKQPYPASLTPALRNLNQNQSAGPSSRRAGSSVGGGSNAPSVAASASAASSGFVPPRQPLHVAKVPADQLRFFANDAKAKSEASGSRRAGPGDADYRPGESGIDDLLALAAQLPSQPNGTSTAASERPDLSRNVSMSNLSTMYDEDDEDEWKPNTWHFGEAGARQPKSKQNLSSHGSQSFDGDESNNYTGWNDAPPPHAIVAKAYDGGKAHQRRQAQKSHRLLYDLAAGLPPNTGAASKWARPIQFGDSLPKGPPGVPSGGTSTIAGGSGSGKNKGFGKLLDDTIRGRISVEAALEGALEGVRSKTSSFPQTQSPQRRSVALPPSPAPSRRPQPSAAAPPRAQAQAEPVTLIDPLSTPSMLRTTSSSSNSGLEQRRIRVGVDWTKGKDD